MIERFIIDRIMEAARIEDVVGDFVDLKKRGVRYLGLCPFHADRSLGSFVVYPKRNCYRCFSCGARGGVVDFLMRHEHLTYPDAIRWLGKKYSIETDMKDFTYTPPPPRPAPPPIPMLTLPMSMVHARENLQGDALVDWIKTCIRWGSEQRERIAPMLHDYHIGHSAFGHTIFWQIDERGQVRTGKMMKYRADGHRDKESKWNFDFIHAALFRDRRHPEYDEDKMEMRQTLFGMHLLNHYGPDATVCIVESEKTALLMSIAYGNHPTQVWMACGGLENLTRERLKPIIDRRRRITLYPDRDAIGRWQQKAEQLHYGRLTVDTRPVLKWWREGDGPKADIADVVIRMLNEAKPMHNTQQVADAMPHIKGLIDTFDLEVSNTNKDDRQPER